MQTVMKNDLEKKVMRKVTLRIIPFIMLNQAAGDRQILAKQLNISPHQLSPVDHGADCRRHFQIGDLAGEPKSPDIEKEAEDMNVQPIS